MTDTTPSGADKRAKKAKKAKPAREETTSRTTLADEIRDVIAEAREAFASEINFQKARAALAGKYAGGIAVMGVLALIVAVFALMALVIGVLLGLSALYGPWIATAAVVGGLLLIAGIAVLLALGKLRKLKRLFAKKDA